MSFSLRATAIQESRQAVASIQSLVPDVMVSPDNHRSAGAARNDVGIPGTLIAGHGKRGTFRCSLSLLSLDFRYDKSFLGEARAFPSL
jgi:hypothetical protein